MKVFISVVCAVRIVGLCCLTDHTVPGSREWNNWECGYCFNKYSLPKLKRDKSFHRCVKIKRVEELLTIRREN
jgi:hypothetical protein